MASEIYKELQINYVEHNISLVYECPPLCKCQYPGGNIYTKVEIFTQRWKYLHKGGNIYTKVEIFTQRWKYLHKGGNIYTKVEIFTQRWKYLKLGGNI